MTHAVSDPGAPSKGAPIGGTLIAIGIFFAAILIAFLNNTSDWATSAHPWNMGDWLLSYEGGFVRRGLLGSVILWFSDTWNLSPVEVIAGLQGILFAGFLAQLFLLLRGRKLPLYYLLLLVSPAAVFFPILDPQGGGRKELLLFAMLAFWLLQTERRGAQSWLSVGLMAGAIGLMTLAHEIFLFLSPAFAIALLGATIREDQDAPISRELLMKAAALVAAPFVVSVLAIIFGKTEQAAQIAMCQALVERNLPQSICAGAIAFPMDSRMAVENTWQQINAYQYFRFYFAYLFAAMAPIMLAVAHARGVALSFKSAMSNPAVIAVLMGLCVLPLFVIALDWGRWAYIYLTVCLLLYAPLLPKREGTEDRLPVWMTAAGAVCVIGYGALWSLPHCCSVGYGASLFTRIIGALT